MLAALFLLLNTVVGYLIIKRIFPKSDWYENLAAGWIVGILISSWVALLCISLFGYALGSIMTIILLACVGYCLYQKTIFVAAPRLLLLFLFIWGTLFSWLFSHSMLRPAADGWHTAPYVYGDVALHSTIINHFVQQKSFSLNHPLVADTQLRYPFLLHFHTALLIRWGLSMQTVLITTGMMIVLASLTLMYQFCLSVSNNTLVPWIASGLYLFNGGAGWLLLFKDTSSFAQLITTLRHLPIDYTYLETEQILWSNVITTHILPQRGFMIGLAITVVVLRCLQLLWNSKKIKIKQLVAVTALISLSPLFHSHTFLFLTPLYGWILFWMLKHKKIIFNQLLIIIVPLLLGIAQIFYITAGSHQSFLQLQLGWKAGDNVHSFWLKNMGLDVLVFILGSVVFYQLHKKNSFESLLVIPSLAVYILCNLFIFQPNDWDNMKFLLLAFLIPCLLGAAVIADFFVTDFRRVLVSIALFLTMFSGILSVTYVLQQDWLLVSQTELSIAREIKKVTDPDALMLTSDAHNHLVPMIAGRPIVLGYKGWLWTHGIDYAELDQKVRAIYAGEDSADQVIKELGIDYIFIGSQEHAVYIINTAFFERRFSKVLQHDGVVVYKVD